MRQDPEISHTDDITETHLHNDDADVFYEKGKKLLCSFLEGYEYKQVVGETPEILREAETCFINVLKIDQNHRHAQILLGKIFFLIGRMREAAILIGNALNFPPYSPEWIDAPGVVYMGFGIAGFEKLVRILRRYRKYFPEDNASLALLARGYFNLHRYKKAEPLLEELVERDPMNFPYEKSCLEFIRNDLKKSTKEMIEETAASGKKMKESDTRIMGEIKS